MTAYLDSRTFREVDGCAHCRAPVRVTNYALGLEVEHYDPSAGFPSTAKGTAWRMCRNSTTATLPGPRREPRDDSGNYLPQCGSSEPHDFHHFTVPMVDGEHWCSGLCDCGMRGYDHGPGEHK